MSYREKEENLKKIISPLLEEEGFVLVELRLMSSKSGAILRLLADRKEGGINLEDCARLNEKVSSLLDAQDLIEDRYILEVSSPGVDRDLLTKDDFSRCASRKVRVFFNESNDGKMEIEGRVNKVEGDLIFIEMSGGVFGIPLSKIKKARQIVDKF